MSLESSVVLPRPFSCGLPEGKLSSLLSWVGFTSMGRAVLVLHVGVFNPHDANPDPLQAHSAPDKTLTYQHCRGTLKEKSIGTMTVIVPLEIWDLSSISKLELRVCCPKLEFRLFSGFARNNNNHDQARKDTDQARIIVKF